MRSLSTVTDGRRGTPGPDWSERDLLAVLTALAPTAPRRADERAVLVGHDGRAGSRELAHLAADFLAQRDVRCVLATGPAPTPALGRLVREDPELRAAVVMTASHNPPGFFGVKLRDEHGHGCRAGEGAPADVALDIARHPHRTLDVLESYTRTVGRPLADAAARFDGALVIDAAHGAVGELAERLPELAFSRARPLPFFAGQTPDPTLRPQADACADRALRAARAPSGAMVAMVDGDGDRLVLYTRRSRTVGSAEQAAILLRAGLPVRRLITTDVAPLMISRAAADTGREVAVTRTEVGFRHVLAAWRSDRAGVLGLEPNGALVWSGRNGDGYFERDSLAALSLLLRAFPGCEAVDDAVAELRRRHPYQQFTRALRRPADDVLSDVRALLPGWRRDRCGRADATAVFEDGRHGRVAVRPSATEPCTRLYVETDPETADRLMTGLRG
ncbi:hypothetical protein [Streptomyces sp. NPDC050263]|uniref:hypothetical protein n=1 Tax=Streptomyces sp. NPDC050263 TaxID=3155037 RepID=UPI003413BB1A